MTRLAQLTLPLAVFSLLLPQSAAAQTIYEDGTFELGTAGAGGQGWTERGPFALPEEAGPGDMDSEQLTTGGNPDYHLRFTIEGVSVPMGESWEAWGILINEGAIYDPGSLGAIERIDFDFDARLPPDDIRGNRVVSLALQQDEFLWAARDTRVFIDDAVWTSKWIFGLEAADFSTSVWEQPGQPPNPDFSEDGSPIAFGLLTGVSCPTTSDCSLTPVPTGIDIDNWKVAVNYTGVSLKLSVEQVPPLGELSELDLEFVVSATVRNAGPSEATDIDVRFLLPKKELADFSIPEAVIVEGPPEKKECVPSSTVDGLHTIADCFIPGPIGPASTATVVVPRGEMADPPAHISVGYANTVPVPDLPPGPDAGPPDPRSGFFVSLIYKAELLSFSGGDPGPAGDRMDEVVVAICNPSGMDPVRVQDGAACDALVSTGGTSGAGGGAGTGGASTGGSSGGCSCDVATTSSSAPWLLILSLAGAALWLRRRRA